MSWIWPDMRGAGGGASVSRPASLLPAGYLGAIQQLSGLRNGAVVNGTDRSGNGLNAGNINPTTLPDLIPGQSSLVTAPIASGPGGAGLTCPGYAQLRLQGSMTLIARVASFGYWSLAAYGFIYSCVNYADGTAGGNCQWSLLAHPVNGLRYFCQSGAGKVAQVFDSSAALYVSDGAWHVVSMRRDASTGIVTLGRDGIFESSGPLLLPTNGSTSLAGWSRAFTAGGVDAFYGQIAETGIWDFAMTDAQLAAATSIMMGS